MGYMVFDVIRNDENQLYYFFCAIGLHKNENEIILFLFTTQLNTVLGFPIVFTCNKT